jgi:hypothetical protein
MTCTDDSFIDRWMKHMDGAAQLIEHRGLEQLNRPEGLRLFTQLRAQIVGLYTCCLPLHVKYLPNHDVFSRLLAGYIRKDTFRLVWQSSQRVPNNVDNQMTSSWTILASQLSA